MPTNSSIFASAAPLATTARARSMPSPIEAATSAAYSAAPAFNSTMSRAIPDVLSSASSSNALDSATFADPNGVGTWFADPSVQAREATAWTLGVNWYLTQNVAWYLDYTKTRFDGGAAAGGDRADESAFFTRFQVAF